MRQNLWKLETDDVTFPGSKHVGCKFNRVFITSCSSAWRLHSATTLISVGCLKITKRQAIEKQNFGRVSAPRREGSTAASQHQGEARNPRLGIKARLDSRFSAPRREGSNPRLSIKARLDSRVSAPRREGSNPHLNIKARVQTCVSTSRRGSIAASQHQGEARQPRLDICARLDSRVSTSRRGSTVASQHLREARQPHLNICARLDSRISANARGSTPASQHQGARVETRCNAPIPRIRGRHCNVYT